VSIITTNGEVTREPKPWQAALICNLEVLYFPRICCELGPVPCKNIAYREAVSKPPYFQLKPANFVGVWVPCELVKTRETHGLWVKAWWRHSMPALVKFSRLMAISLPLVSLGFTDQATAAEVLICARQPKVIRMRDPQTFPFMTGYSKHLDKWTSTTL